MIEAGRSFEILILAGGLGTRLRPIVSDVPKPMARVDGKPFLAWLLDYWIKQKPARIVLSIGYLGHVVMDYFGEDYCGIPITYVHEDAPLGTGGAVKCALEKGAFGLTPVLLLNGDTWFRANIGALQVQLEDGFHLAMTIKRLDNNDRYGRVILDAENRIVDFEKFREGPGFINVGCYLLNPNKMRCYLKSFQYAFSLEEHALQPLARAGKIAASLQDGPFLDIGIPADYEKASVVLRR